MPGPGLRPVYCRRRLVADAARLPRPRDALDDLQARVEGAAAPSDPLSEAFDGMIGDGDEDGHHRSRS
jgi:hypothetical protein